MKNGERLTTGTRPEPQTKIFRSKISGQNLQIQISRFKAGVSLMAVLLFSVDP
jgi:hypothetical protein